MSKREDEFLILIEKLAQLAEVKVIVHLTIEKQEDDREAE